MQYLLFFTLIQANHSQLLLPEDDSKEMDRLKNHIDTLLDEQEKKRPSSSSPDGMFQSHMKVLIY